ncbi:MAG: multidrug efflux protein [Puniceicoccaceae bacterium]|nr:MAG: multidrug efflux protein [Puniceicoccaceae bacterium]
MKLTDTFINRPVLAVVINLVILIAGFQAIKSLSVRQYPRSDNAAVTISTVYVGASAELVRGFITTPLERAIAAADGIDYIQSESRQGFSQITARLRLGVDPNAALAEISSKVDQVRNDLPPEAEVPTINIESADSEFASAYLSFDSEILEQNEITDYLLRVVQPRLSALEGVQRAEILGARTFAMRIWLLPDKMAALGISPAEVRRALAANNFLAAVGQTRGALIQVNLTANTDLQSAEEFRDLVVRRTNGAVIRLGDIADVVLGAQDYDSEVTFTGQTAVFIGVWPLPTANAVDVIGLVSREIDALQADLPTGLSARVAYDATAFINDAIREVLVTLSQTLAIVILVIFLFLGSLRSVLVPVVSIPIALIGAVFLMQLFGFTLNLLTLLAIVLAVGLVVDDAIVMVENVSRHIREGKRPYLAAIISARELFRPIAAMAFTLAAVYAPIGFQGGLTGSLFREFALTLAGAVVISASVAITLSPVLASRVLRSKPKETGFAAHIDRNLDRLREAYGRALDAVLAARGAVYVFWVAVIGLIVVLFTQSPAELAPTEDQGVVFGILDTPANASLEQMSVAAGAIFDVYSQVPEMAQTFQLTQPGFGIAGLVTTPWGQRDRHIREVLRDVQGGLAGIPGARVFPVLPPALPGGGQFPVEFVIASTAEIEEIAGFADELAARAAASGIFAFPPIVDARIDQAQTEIVLDRDKIGALGLTLESVGRDLAGMVGGGFVNRFNVAGRSYRVIPQVTRLERLTAEQLGHLHVTGPEGSLIPLSSVAAFQDQVQPRSLNRFQQLNAVKISGVSIRPLDEALRFLEDEAAGLLPRGYRIDYTGESRQLRSEGATFLPMFGLAVVLIFLVLAAQFNSFRDPLIILGGSVPLAMFGALIFTFLRMPNPEMGFWTDRWTTTLNIYSQVGLVTLVGIIAKNGILIVEFANVLQERGLTKARAIREAAKIRLRPVLMTSLATIFGYLPLILVTGAGAAARNSIGLVVVGGMVVGTFFTLFVVPTLYQLIARDRAAVKDNSAALEAEIEAARKNESVLAG